MLLEICTGMLLVACFMRLCYFINSLHSAQRLLDLVLCEDLEFFFPMFSSFPLWTQFFRLQKSVYIYTGGKRSRKTGKRLGEMQAMAEIFQDCFQDLDIQIP